MVRFVFLLKLFLKDGTKLLILTGCNAFDGALIMFCPIPEIKTEGVQVTAVAAAMSVAGCCGIGKKQSIIN